MDNKCKICFAAFPGFLGRALLLLLFGALTLQTNAEGSPYQSEIKVARERYGVLYAEWRDYRKPKPGLPPAKEEERLRLRGFLFENDPIGVLFEQIQTDISAFRGVPVLAPEDGALLDCLKDFLAITQGFEERATTREQAEQFATELRRLLARRDVVGANKWAKAQK